MAKSSSTEAINPLRPYYIPPSIGTSPTISNTSRDVFPDVVVDLASSTSSEAWQVTRNLLDSLVWRYTSTLLAQPFDVAKTLLQVSLPLGGGDGERNKKEESETSEEEEEDEEDEMPDYFSTAAPTISSPKIRSRRRKRDKKPPPSSSVIRLTKPASVMHAVSQLYAHSGATGLWRASNTTFLYSILLRTTDSFIRSLLLALLALPEISTTTIISPSLTTPLAAATSGIDLSDSPQPLASLIVIAVSSCITGLVLLPLDMIRTRLLTTPISHSPRGLVQNLTNLPSLLAPSRLWLPTSLYHSLPSAFSASMPLFLRRQLRLTPESSPTLWSLAAFTTTLTELFLRLPLETVLRRAQLDTLIAADPHLPLIVTPGAYRGVWGTMYSILYLEGETMTRGKNGMLKRKRGQGVSGLVRGWRIGFWGLAGVWGAGALGGEGKGREF